MSQFYNTTSFIIDRKIRRANEDFNINPFKDGKQNQLGLVLNFRNTLFFNRGKQRYTTNYTYLNTATDNLQSLGLQSSKLESHQLNFTHKFAKSLAANCQRVSAVQMKAFLKIFRQGTIF